MTENSNIIQKVRQSMIEEIASLIKDDEEIDILDTDTYVHIPTGQMDDKGSELYASDKVVRVFAYKDCEAGCSTVYYDSKSLKNLPLEDVAGIADIIRHLKGLPDQNLFGKTEMIWDNMMNEISDMLGAGSRIDTDGIPVIVPLWKEDCNGNQLYAKDDVIRITTNGKGLAVLKTRNYGTCPADNMDADSMAKILDALYDRYG